MTARRWVLSPRHLLVVLPAPTLSKLWHSGALTAKGLAQSKALRIIFVPDPAESATPLRKDFALTFKSLTIELPRQP